MASVSWSGRHAVVSMPPELDLSSSAEAGELLVSATRTAADVISADLTGTRYCDSAGVHAIARAWERSAASGAELRLVIADPGLARIFEITGLNQIMPVYPDVRQSLDTPRGGPAPPGTGDPPGIATPGLRAGLQEALLPAVLPVLPRVRIAAGCLAAGSAQAEGAGWFDAVPLAGGSVALAVGAAPGRGAAAVAAMGQLRAVLAERLTAEADPAAAVAQAGAYASHRRALHPAALVLAVLDPGTGTLRHLSCGHPAPLLISLDGTSRVLADSGTGPLGTGRVPPVATTRLRPGELVLLYSDMTAGQTRPERVAPADPDRLCQRTLTALAHAGQAGDVTAMAAQWLPQPAPELHLDLAAEIPSVHAARRWFGDWLSQLDPLLRDRDALLLAVSELISNAVEHAYPPGRAGRVELHVMLGSGGDLECRVADHGQWRAPGPSAPWRGQGLMVAAHLADEMRVHHPPQDAAAAPGGRGTVVTLRHRLSRPATVAARAALPPPAASPPFRLAITADGAAARATAHGRLDASTADRLAAQLLAACHGGTRPLTVDLRQATELTSAAVHVLHQVKQQLNAHHQDLTLRAAPGSPADAMLTIARLRSTNSGSETGPWPTTEVR
jgi:anti-anti-sigma factor